MNKKSLKVKSATEVHLFGSLTTAQRGNSSQQVQFVAIQDPMALKDFLNYIRIPSDTVQLAMVNHKAVPRGYMISPSDRVALFPKEYPIYPDWNDFRL